MDARLEQNRRHWDEITAIHVASEFYDVPRFLAGASSLLPIEEREIAGTVAGQKVVHLQCHFGLDTLSLARRGADVCGVDFSVAALAQAEQLADRARLSARFVTSEVTRAPEALGGEQFDLVYTSWGVLGWLPDLAPWADAVSRLLRPRGRFYIAEIHPVIFLYEGSDPLEQTYPYFRQREPIVEEDEGTYADRDARVRERRRYSWIYELGQVVTELSRAGLRIEFVHEHDATCAGVVDRLEPGDDRMFRLPAEDLSLPLSFSILATK